VGKIERTWRVADTEVRFRRQPLIGSSGDLAGDTEAWLASEPLAALVTEFGGGPDHYIRPEIPLAARLSALDTFTERWDTRRGLERNLAPELDLSEKQQSLVIDASNALGLRGDPPRHRHYDHMLMLGGLIRACVARPFVGNEFEQAAELGWGDLGEEYEALDAGTRRAFDLGEPEFEEGERFDDIGGTWGVKHYRTADGLPIRVVAAPSSEPDTRRANSADSYKFFADHVANLKPGERLLLISTAIYVLPQHVAALRILALPYGVDIDTIGGKPTQRPRLPLSHYSATKYLLEVRSTVRALAQLVAELP